MISKILVFACVQVAFFNAASSQCANRIPNAIPVAENVVPNQVIYNPLPNQYLVNPNQVFVNPPNQVFVNPAHQIFVNPPTVETVIPAPVPIIPNPVSTTTIIQDSTVANNLANALQLLIVSNLLSNTLPNCAAPEVIPTIAGPVEVIPTTFPGAIDVFPSFPGLIEVFSKVPVAPGCGFGNYNFVY